MIDTNELGWADLLKLADETKADNGPGTAAWHAQGSETVAARLKLTSGVHSKLTRDGRPLGRERMWISVKV